MRALGSGPAVRQPLKTTEAWHWLREKMQAAFVVLCCPRNYQHREDAARIAPRDKQDWRTMHLVYRVLME